MKKRKYKRNILSTWGTRHGPSSVSTTDRGLYYVDKIKGKESEVFLKQVSQLHFFYLVCTCKL